MPQNETSPFIARDLERRHARVERIDQVADIKVRTAYRHAYYAANLERLVAHLVTPGARVLEDSACALERPSLDEAGRIQPAFGSMRPDVEVALARQARLLAQRQNLDKVWAAVRLIQFASNQPADFTVGLVGAESEVDVAQVVEGPIQRRPGDGCVANIQADRGPHDVLDSVEAGQGGGG